jgi:hypothetical protein
VNFKSRIDAIQRPETMHTLRRLALVATMAATLISIPTTLLAQNQQNRQNRQNRGNVDPAQAQQRMMERYREQLGVTNDDEWKAIEGRVQKVLDARREVGFGGMGRGMMMGRGGRGGGGGGAANDNATAGAGQGGGRRGGGRQLSPAAQELQQAIEAKAPTDEIKTKLAKYREDRQQKEANLQKAQDDLKKVLNSRQEATAVLMGLLN